MKVPTLRKEVLDSLPSSIQMGIGDLQYDFMKMDQVSDPQFVSQIKHSIQIFFRVLEEAYSTSRERSRLSDQFKSIEDGIQFISDAITNRLQSGRHLYEASLFNPHNMGSFSKVYSFYESFVDLFETLIVAYNKKRNEKGANSELSLLVDISKSSSVNAQHFVPDTGHKFPKNVLIGITINEYAFFQIKDTIVLLLHEIGHYVRPFERRKRNKVLVKIAFNWLAHMAYDELSMYLYSKVLSSYYNETADGVQDKIKQLITHFEDVLSPAVHSVVYKALNDRFEEFIQTKAISKEFGTGDQHVNLLNEFQRLVDHFLADLSTHLSEILFSAQPEANNPVGKKRRSQEKALQFGVKHWIIYLMKKKNEANKQSKNQSKVKEEDVSFDHLCQLATRLFDPGNIFKYEKGMGNSTPDRAIDCYLNSLSLLGLNEPSTSNLNLFAEVLVQCLKRSLEAFKDESILEMLIRNFEESLANMFWIRTLNVKDFETYWKIVKPLIHQSVLSEQGQIRIFGIPNAIITEYFALLGNNGNAMEAYEYKLPPVADLRSISRNNGRSAKDDETKMIDWLREIFFLPVAIYLIGENDLFPEKHLFQLGEKITSKNGKLVNRLRGQFRNFMSNTETGGGFFSELEMINFFEDFATGK